MSDVLVRVEGRAGRITLNRPRALNALTLDMILSIDAALGAWEHDDAIRLVLVDGAGERGLCAGGDIRSLYDAIRAGDMGVTRDFFRAEYRMNARIAAYPKPYVAFMDGISMGGGIGISAHGSYRVVTERSRLAMPEVGIGFVPDVGGTFLLGRAPGKFGIHAALTASQLGAADAILCGLADMHVDSACLADLAVELAACDTEAALRACLEGRATPPAVGKLAGAEAWISACYDNDPVEAIYAALSAHPDPAARQAAADMAGKCPFSLKLALRAVRHAATQASVNPCLDLEYRLALFCLARPDFREGVRAALVDKDRNPAWQPARLDAVTDGMVEAAFAAPDFGGLGLQ